MKDNTKEKNPAITKLLAGFFVKKNDLQKQKNTETRFAP
jgi:hypothetical protein